MFRRNWPRILMPAFLHVSFPHHRQSPSRCHDNNDLPGLLPCTVIATPHGGMSSCCSFSDKLITRSKDRMVPLAFKPWQLSAICTTTIGPTSIHTASPFNVLYVQNGGLLIYRVSIGLSAINKSRWQENNAQGCEYDVLTGICYFWMGPWC